MTPLSRRSVLRAGLVTGAGLAAAATPGSALAAPTAAAPTAAAPGLVRAGRPAVSHGVQSGDPTAHSGLIWARADRPARMHVEWSTDPGFGRVRRVRGPLVTPDTDLTGRVRLVGLPAGAESFYRVSFADPDDDSVRGDAVAGALRTAPKDHRDVRFCWTADIAGQGWGVNPDLGGYPLFRAMHALRPDFYLSSGDNWYADNPVSPTVTLPDGRIWRNVVTPEKTKVAETLAEFRGQARYNLLADTYRAMIAEIPVVAQWDDHETHNNWFPHQILDDARYTVTDVDVLAARARRAFAEYFPVSTVEPDGAGRIYRTLHYGPLLEVFMLDMRTYKDPNTTDLETTPDGGILGWRQLAWLKRELARSRATWKVVANDLPLGLIVPDGPRIEAVAQGDNGAPLGRELELAGLLRWIGRAGIRNIIWLTADVHYTAAHYYDPARAAFGDFAPFWEFVAGPANAGAFGPNVLDGTFGPQAVFVEAPPTPNASPLQGFQYFGEVAIDGATRDLTVRLRGLSGDVRWSLTLPAQHR
jgi:alkaline phosphatase D